MLTWHAVQFSIGLNTQGSLYRWFLIFPIFLTIGSNLTSSSAIANRSHCRVGQLFFSLSEMRFYTENGRFAILSRLRELRDNVRCSSYAHWKARSELPISVNWTFLARCYGWGATGENRSKIGLLQRVWVSISKISFQV